ncbi:hypothetical protein [Nocardioides hwasunensis]|uniref:Uncharacterized protein n=1 Tax=Nocardioides hwasunensis TaxID=397258 RepID=A0ABR8MLK4_9ACTN|nr:hypothetical protein [Nocardioides hwasunensis]MBD3916895.1 hypothetical protein [Nocardioides hwasunensis]
MSTPTAQRPPQVTLASAIVIFASVMVLLTAWGRVSTLGSLETQQGIRDFLGEAPFADLGLTVPGATQILRITCMVAAASACATAILGWYVRKPDRSSRLALTIFAVPVFVTGFASGGLAGSFVAAGAAMLWMNPGREWFATGKWTPPTPVAKSSDTKGDARGGTDIWGAPRSGSGASGPTDATMPPPAARPFGEPHPPQQSAPQQNPYGQPYPQAPSQPQPHPQAAPFAQQPPYVQSPYAQQPWRQHPAPPARPGAMVAAFVITVVSAGGLLSLSLLWIAIAGLSPEFLMSVIQQQQPQLVEDGLTLAQVRSTIFALAGAFIVWCSLALLLAGFAMARRAWARRGLLTSAAFSAVACFALVLATPLVLVPAAAAVATVVCLLNVQVKRWFSLDAR